MAAVETSGSTSAKGVLPSFLEPYLEIPMVSTIDVGRAAAELLSETWIGKRIVELGGPQDWSVGDVAAAIFETLGRPVAPAFVPPEARAALLDEAGVPEDVAAALLGMYDGLASGRVAREQGTTVKRGTVSLNGAIAGIVTKLRAAA